MNIPNTPKSEAFDENNNRIERKITGEDYVLHEEILPKPARFVIHNGVREDIAAKRGIDINTCTFMEGVNWLADTRIKKSQTSKMYVHRKLSFRFEALYKELKPKIDARDRIEYEMIKANTPRSQDPAWFGEVSIHGLVRLDGSLTNPRSKTIRLKNDTFNVVRK